jgi:type III secretion protein L
VNKKFFTLIYGDKIQSAPGSKIIPAEAFSKLADASEILEHIKKDAERYRHAIALESEKIKENAHKEGYEAGFEKWSEHLVRLEEQIHNVREEIQKTIIPVALKAARKIVAKELELAPATIVDIVASTLKSVAQHKRIIIYVNQEDLEILDKNKLRLKDIFESLESLSIRSRSDVEPGGCVIETEIGIINAQLEHRWHILEKAFETMIKPSTPPVQKS